MGCRIKEHLCARTMVPASAVGVARSTATVAGISLACTFIEPLRRNDGLIPFILG